MAPLLLLPSAGRPLLVLAAIALASWGVGCASGGGRYDVDQLEKSLARGDAGLVLGDFPLRNVVDGDTVRVGGLGASLRLLGMDTEETFKNEKDRRGYERGFEHYLRWKASLTDRPVKVATPLGEEAKLFAKHFFEGVTTVRLERDHPKEVRDVYARYLAYVFAKKEGRWLNYNVEAIRAGVSPYFSKYGYSRRFHRDFVEAQNQARKAKIGIWDPKKEHYTDYDARLTWWTHRAEFVAAFEREAEGKEDYIPLTNWDAIRRLEALKGKTASVLGGVGSIKRIPNGPVIAQLARSRTENIGVVFQDPFVFDDSKLAKAKGEYAVIRGVVSEYVNKRTGRKSLQLTVSTAASVRIANYVPPGNGFAGVKPTAAAAPDPYADFYEDDEDVPPGAPGAAGSATPLED